MKSDVLHLLEYMDNVRILNKENDSVRVQIVKGSNNIVSLPLSVSNDLSYIVAAVICDGHIKRDKYRVVFENVNLDTVKKFSRCLENVFGINAYYFKIYDKRKGRKLRYRIEINSKPLVVLLNKIFEIPRGKKSDKIKVPKVIKESNIEIKKSFIEGVFDTDGGKRHGTLGLSSKSKKFRDDVAVILNDLNIRVNKDEWINKVYKQKYYGFYFKVKRGYPSGQRGQLSHFLNVTGDA
jgi:intein/homing endonuclease